MSKLCRLETLQKTDFVQEDVRAENIYIIYPRPTVIFPFCYAAKVCGEYFEEGEEGRHNNFIFERILPHFSKALKSAAGTNFLDEKDANKRHFHKKIFVFTCDIIF